MYSLQDGVDRMSTGPGVTEIGLPIFGQISTNCTFLDLAIFRVGVAAVYREYLLFCAKNGKNWCTLTSGIPSRIEPCQSEAGTVRRFD